MNGIYIHVPFCVKKCMYCDFYSETDLSKRDAYVRALTREIALSATSRHAVDTVYLGGGTPSVLSLEQLEMIFSALHDHYDIRDGSEITLEANPGTVDQDYITGLKRIGVNRLSLGVQSFQDENLHFLGRIHHAEQAISLITAARKAGFDNLGFDLMYGLPHQTDHDWQKDLETALSFDPAHLSCYMLTWESGTPLYQRMEQGLASPLDEISYERLFFETMALLERHGFDHYEISNFARTPCFRSRHNSKYWNFQPYYGFGPSAHSYMPDANRRYWNVRDLNTYIETLNHNRLPISEQETLTPNEQITEALFLSLRTKEGIAVPDFNQRFDRDFLRLYGDILWRLEKDGLIVMETNHVRLTQKGMVLADRITSLLVNHTE